MNPLQSHDLLPLVVKYLNLNSCLVMLRVNKQIRQYIGTSEVWNKFHALLKKPASFSNYYELCQALAGNPLIPNSIAIQKYYGENYYRFVFSKFSFMWTFTLFDYLRCRKLDLKKTDLIFQEYLLSPRPGMITKLLPQKERKTLLKLLTLTNFQVQKKLLINPYARQLIPLAIRIRDVYLVFEAYTSLKLNTLKLSIFKTWRPDWKNISTDNIDGVYEMEITRNSICPNDQYWKSIEVSTGLDAMDLFEIVNKVIWFYHDLRF